MSAAAIATAGAAFAQTAPTAPTPAPTESARPSGLIDDAQDAANQDAATTLDEIIVTGTSIRGAAPTGSTVTTLGAETLQRAPQATITDIVRQLPQVATSGATEGLLAGGFNPAANRTYGNGINLRALGPDATLILVNGHRLAKTGTQANFIDPSLIPTAAIERVEVVADGASAVYGSDAVGGVVNFILRDDFDGAETTIRGGVADGMTEWQFSQVFGKAWSTGSIMLTYERYHRDNLAGEDRPYFTQDLRPFGGRDYRSAVAATPGNIIVGGVTYAIPETLPPSGRVEASDLIRGVPNRFDSAIGADIFPRNDRETFLTTFRQELSDKFRIFGDAVYSERDFEHHPTGGIPTGTFNVPRANPFFVHPTNPAAATVPVAYAFYRELGARQDIGTIVNTGFSGGFEYDLFDRWRIRGFANLNVDNNQRDQTNALNNAAVAIALADTNPATSLNLFGGGNSPETIARIRQLRQVELISTLTEQQVQIDGPLWALPGGDMRLAVGLARLTEKVEYEQKFDGVIDTVGSTEREDIGIFAELFLPLIGPDNNVPFVHQLTVSLAGRAEEYDTAGSTQNPKVGVVWAPVEGFKLRGSYGTSFKAPSLGYTLPVLAALVQPSLSIDPRTGQQVQVLSVTGGNEGLSPETATTWSFGADWEPSFLPRARLSVNYFDVVFENQVGNPAVNLNQYDIYQQFIIRDPDVATVNRYLSGEVAPFLGGRPPADSVVYILDNRFQNLGGFVTKGIDFVANYSFDTDIGGFDLTASATHTLVYDNQVAVGLPFIDRLNTPFWPQEWRGRGEVVWTNGPWRASATGNYVDSYTNDLVAVPVEVDSHFRLDGSISYTTDPSSGGWARGIDVTLSVQNLFDVDPPFLSSDAGNVFGFDATAASPLGRFVSLRISKSW